MDFANISLFSVMKAKLNFLSERQAVLAQNVANADTPGYRAMDVTAPDFEKMLKESGSGALQMKSTNPKHVTHGSVSAGMFEVKARAKTDELNPNQNNVSIEEEMAQVGQNQAEYQKVLNLYGKAISMFKTAIGNSNAG